MSWLGWARPGEARQGTARDLMKTKRENLIADEDKEKLVEVLKDMNILPVRQGEVSIHISPERKISGVKVTSLLS